MGADYIRTIDTFVTIGIYSVLSGLFKNRGLRRTRLKFSP
jgi:hypothetical protein